MIMVIIDNIMSANIIMSIILVVGMMMMFMISIVNTIFAFTQIVKMIKFAFRRRVSAYIYIYIYMSIRGAPAPAI